MLIVRSGIDGRVTNSGVPRYRGLADRHLVVARGEQIDDDIVALTAETTQSDDPGVAGRPPAGAARRQAGQGRSETWSPRTATSGRTSPLDLHEGERHTVEKVVALYTSRDRAISEPGRRSAGQGPARPGPARPARPARAGLGSPVGALRPADQRARAGRPGVAPAPVPAAADAVRAQRRPRRGHPGARPARRGLPGPHLLGRRLRLPLPEPADARTVAGAAALPVAAAAAGPRGGPRDRLPGRDVPVAERVQRPGGNPDPAPEPALGPVDPGQLPPAAPHQRRRSPTAPGSTTRRPATPTSSPSTAPRSSSRSRSSGPAWPATTAPTTGSTCAG